MRDETAEELNNKELRRIISWLLAQTNCTIPMADVDRYEPADVVLDERRGSHGVYVCTGGAIQQEPPPQITVPSEVTTHGAPPDVNPAAMQEAIEQAGLPRENPSRDGCGDEYCIWCSDYEMETSIDHACDMDGCRRPTPLGARWCRRHLCRSNRVSRCCIVRRCNGIRTDLLCTAHNAQWMTVSDRSLFQWLSQFEQTLPGSEIGRGFRAWHEENEARAAAMASEIGRSTAAMPSSQSAAMSVTEMMAYVRSTADSTNQERLRRLWDSTMPVGIVVSGPNVGQVITAEMLCGREQAAREHIAVGRAMGAGEPGDTVSLHLEYDPAPIHLTPYRPPREVRAGDMITAEMLRHPQQPIVVNMSSLWPVGYRPDPDNTELSRIIRRATGRTERCCRGDCTKPREQGHAFCEDHRLPQETRT